MTRSTPSATTRTVIVYDYAGGSEPRPVGQAQFHGFSIEYEELADGVGNYTVAIVEWPNGAVSVSERLPEPNTKVLAHYFNVLGNGRTICAIWVPAKSRSNDISDDDNDFTEYDEETGKHYWPEGWYETIEHSDELGYIKVYEGEVACWQPLPQWPARPIPLPQAGEGE